MSKNKSKQTRAPRSPLEEARLELRSLRIPWYEVELAAAEVSKANPLVEGEELVKLIVNAAVDHWSTGMGC